METILFALWLIAGPYAVKLGIFPTLDACSSISANVATALHKTNLGPASIATMCIPTMPEVLASPSSASTPR